MDDSRCFYLRNFYFEVRSMNGTRKVSLLLSCIFLIGIFCSIIFIRRYIK